MTCFKLLIISTVLSMCRVSMVEADVHPSSTQSDVCESNLRNRASARIFQLSLQLRKHNALSTTAFSAVQAALDAVERNGSGHDAERCFSAAPERRERYNDWYERIASKVVTKARRRIREVCVRRTHLLISSYTHKIEASMEAKHLASAASLTDEFEKALRSTPAVLRCQATKSEVVGVLDGFVLSVRNQVALPRVVAQASSVCFRARDDWQHAIQALSTGGRSIVAAAIFESRAGQDSFRETIARCQSHVKSLLELGAPANVLLKATGNDDGDTAIKTLQWCETTQDQLAVMLPKFVAHNRSYHSTMLARWERFTIKGWDMESTYRSRGRPAGESTKGDLTLWNYASDAPAQCTQYSFNSRGKLVGSKNEPCTPTQP